MKRARMSKTLRKAVGRRAGWRCDMCGCFAPHDFGQAHHRKLRSRGGGDSLANLAWVCGVCHMHIHAEPALSTARGWMVPSWGDPAGFAVQRYDGRRYLPDGENWKRAEEAR